MGSEIERDDQLAIVAEKLDRLSAGEVKTWLEGKLRNCRLLAGAKVGEDRDEWPDDAAYFAAALGLIDWSANP